MQTTPNYSLLIVRENFHLIKLCYQIQFKYHINFYSTFLPQKLPIFAHFWPFFIKKNIGKSYH